MLATVAATHESRRNRLQPREISVEEQRHPRTSCSFRPSLPPYPSLPGTDPRSDRFRCGGRESAFLAVSRASALYFLSNMDVTRRTSYNTLRPVS